MFSQIFFHWIVFSDGKTFWQKVFCLTNKHTSQGLWGNFLGTTVECASMVGGEWLNCIWFWLILHYFTKKVLKYREREKHMQKYRRARGLHGLYENLVGVGVCENWWTDPVPETPMGSWEERWKRVSESRGFFPQNFALNKALSTKFSVPGICCALKFLALTELPNVYTTFLIIYSLNSYPSSHVI